MRRAAVLFVVAVATVGCAKRPDAIAPVSIPMAAYSNLSCKGLQQEYRNEHATLAAVSKAQNEAATGDAVGVFLLGVPMSSTFGGDKAGDVGVSKGKIVALEANMTSKNCTIPPKTPAA